MTKPEKKALKAMLSEQMAAKVAIDARGFDAICDVISARHRVALLEREMRDEEASQYPSPKTLMALSRAIDSTAAKARRLSAQIGGANG